MKNKSLFHTFPSVPFLQVTHASSSCAFYVLHWIHGLPRYKLYMISTQISESMAPLIVNLVVNLIGLRSA
jgi:hypothetical protein